MSSVDRDLVAALRAELAAIEPSRACDLAAERTGLGPVRASAGRAGPSQRDPVLARLELRLGRRGVEAGPAAFAWAASPEHCRMAYLRGRFLSRGSLSVAGARTHLEFVVDQAEAPILAAWLREAGLPASWRVRRGRGVVTWKSAEIVGLFLRRIGAGAALLELEARQVSRALRGELNRILNAESSNLQRSVAAAGRQLAAIDQLEADGRLGEQPYVVRVVAEARRETPEATLAELAERLGFHRSGVQRALERVERLALHGEARSAPLA
ncbi:MAG: DNA-binding protein WhiA [Chloroflexota bacterium]